MFLCVLLPGAVSISVMWVLLTCLVLLILSKVCIYMCCAYIEHEA